MSLNCFAAFFAFICKFRLNRRHAAFFAVFSILGILSGCRVIRTADSVRGHDENWWRNAPRTEDFDWYTTIKLETTDQGGVQAKADLQEQISPNSNVESFNTRVLPLQRNDEWWVTTTSTTEAPDDDDDDMDLGTKIGKVFLFIFAMIATVAAVIFFNYEKFKKADRDCEAMCCGKRRNNPPPEEQRTSGTVQNIGRTPDKLPGYSDVIFVDFPGEPAQFPKVNPDSQPPIYDERKMKY